MPVRSNPIHSLIVVVGGLYASVACAQNTPATPSEAQEAEAPDQAQPAEALRARSSTIGGMPELVEEEYTSPLETLGIALGGNSYVLSAGIGLIYLIFVYPTQALLGHGKVEPVALWLLLPIVGPWMAQYEDLVKDKPGWRGVLIADAGLQAVGLVMGLIGAALSGKRTHTSETTGLELKWAVGSSGAVGLTVTLRSM